MNVREGGWVCERVRGWVCMCMRTRGDMRRELFGSEDAGPKALCFINVQITYKTEEKG